MTCAFSLMSRRPSTVTPIRASSSISLNSACGSMTTPLPMMQVTPRVQDARGNQVQDELLALRRRPCARRCGRPGSARPSRSAASACRRSCPCLRRPTARRARRCWSSTFAPIVLHRCHDRSSRSIPCTPVTMNHATHRELGTPSHGVAIGRSGIGVAFGLESAVAVIMIVVSSVPEIALDGNSLTLEALVAIAHDFAPVALTDAARARVARGAGGRRRVRPSRCADLRHQHRLRQFRRGHHPGRTRWPQLQVNLLRSHAAGVGEPLPVPVVRATMALRANVLAKGFSGIRLETLERLIALLNRGVHPVVPSRGSVGASGDLAPLAHLALVLVGEGEAWHESGARTGRSGAGARRTAGGRRWRRRKGSRSSTARRPSTALLGLAAGRCRTAGTSGRHRRGARASTGCRGRRRPFDPRIHAARGFEGQAKAAANLRGLLDGSGINAAHANCGRVQDAYSMRCAAAGAWRRARGVPVWPSRVRRSRPTRPPITRWCSPTPREIVSGGNFHGAPVAIAADMLCLGLAQLATISERRSERLVNPALSGLPAFLTRHGGLQSGLMMAQVTAAALTSELKTLAHPASVDTIPTSANKEDHVSMSMAAGLKASRALELARGVHRRRTAVRVSGDRSARAAATVRRAGARASTHPRACADHSIDDRPPSHDVASITELIVAGEIRTRVRDESQLKLFSENYLTSRAALLISDLPRSGLLPLVPQHDHRHAHHPVAARHGPDLQGLAAGSGVAHADEQPGPRRRRAPR